MQPNNQPSSPPPIEPQVPVTTSLPPLDDQPLVVPPSLAPELTTSGSIDAQPTSAQQPTVDIPVAVASTPPVPTLLQAPIGVPVATLDTPQPQAVPAPQVANHVPVHPYPAQQPIPASQYSVAQSTPGSGLSIAGFVVSLIGLGINLFTFGIMSVVGLVLSIIGRVKTKRAGRASGLALAGIIISSISIVLTLGFVAVVAFAGIQLGAKCNELGDGVTRVGDKVYSCNVDGKNSIE